MKRNLIGFILLVAVLAISCKKDNRVIEQPQLALPDDTAHVLLKDIVASAVPSPFYHFVYDGKYVKEISFAKSYDVYRLQYENNRLIRMLNINNNDHLEYTYTNRRVSLITEFSGVTQQKLYECFFDYDNHDHLIQVRWFRFVNNNTVKKPYRKVVLTYYADDNLQSIDDYFTDNNGQFVFDSNKQFKEYDTGINVDDFGLLKNFFEPLLFLPSVKLQKNNPGTEIITTAENEYKVAYQYQYNNRLPIALQGTWIATKGTEKGQTVHFSTAYSYY